MRILIGGAVLLVLFAAFVWWRYTSIARGARRVEARILEALQNLGDDPSPDHVASLARRALPRQHLYAALKCLGRLDLFPAEHLSVQAQAEALLARWLLHPNELGAEPERIELAAQVTRDVDDVPCMFCILRFRAPANHWAGRKWLLGIAGPFRPGDEPYSGHASAYVRFGDNEEETNPEELADWYIAVAQRKGAWPQDPPDAGAATPYWANADEVFGRHF